MTGRIWVLFFRGRHPFPFPLFMELFGFHSQINRKMHRVHKIEQTLRESTQCRIYNDRWKLFRQNMLVDSNKLRTFMLMLGNKREAKLLIIDKFVDVLFYLLFFSLISFSLFMHIFSLYYHDDSVFLSFVPSLFSQ